MIGLGKKNESLFFSTWNWQRTLWLPLFQACLYAQIKQATLSTCPGSVALICPPLGGWRHWQFFGERWEKRTWPGTALAVALVPGAGVRWTLPICGMVPIALHPLRVPTRAHTEPHGLLVLVFQASFSMCLTCLEVSNLEDILTLVV